MIPLMIAALGVRAAWLLTSNEPSGWDGFFYVAQAKHLALDGQFHVTDFSWVLYLLSLPHVLGADAAVGIKVTAAFLAALCVPAAYLLGRNVSDRAAWWLAFWAAGSPALTHLAGDFPKNLGAAAPLLFGLALAEHRTFSFAMALLAGWAHRLGAALALAAAPGASRKPWTLLLLIGGLAALVLYPANAPRLKEAFGPLAWPAAPWAYFALRPTSWPEAIELSLAAPALLAALVAFIRKPERRALILSLAVPLVLCALPLWRTDALDLGYRLSLMAPLFAVPLLAISLPLPKPHALAAIVLLGVSVTGFDPQATPDYARYRKIIAQLPKPYPHLLIAHQGINFLYDAETGHEAMAWAPEPELDHTRVYRLAWGIRDGEWLAYAPHAESLRVDPDYVYVREDVWEAFVKRAHEAHDDELEERLADVKNPSKLRP